MLNIRAQLMITITLKENTQDKMKVGFELFSTL